MDLSKLDTTVAADEGAELELLSPIDDSVLRDEATGEPVTIRVIGSDSKDFMKVSQKLNDKRLQKRLSRGKVKLTSAEIDADAMEILVGCTKGWKHVVINKEAVPFNEANVRMLYTKFPWIKEQVDAFIYDRTNFLGES